MTNTNNTERAMWKFQHDMSETLHTGYATDARGLRLRKECGYTHVNMGDGWLQINVAIRKVDMAEKIAELLKQQKAA